MCDNEKLLNDKQLAYLMRVQIKLYREAERQGVISERDRFITEWCMFLETKANTLDPPAHKIQWVEVLDVGGTAPVAIIEQIARANGYLYWTYIKGNAEGNVYSLERQIVVCLVRDLEDRPLNEREN